MDAPWIVVANYLKGVSEYSGALTNPKIEEMFSLSGSPWVHSDETPWCAAFVGACLRLSGFKSSNNLGARSYLNFGARLEEPRPGCIVVLWRGSPDDTSRGHVGFFDHMDESFIYLLGGNQGNMVQVARYDSARVLSFRQPVDIAPMARSTVLRNFNELTGEQDASGGGSATPLAAPTPSPQPPIAPPPMVMPEDPIRIGVPAMAAVDSGSQPNAGTISNFGKIQPIVDKWEGGYVDDPRDPGGATNMGITIFTLASWRGQQVSKADVKALTRGEVWQIMKANYYDVVRGDDLPIGVATGVHNAAVLSGTKRAATWLQQSMQALGSQVGVDGAIGNETIGLAKQLDGNALMEQFFRRQEAFYRGLSTFDRFGAGWMNRIDDVRVFARKLQSVKLGLADFGDTPNSQTDGNGQPASVTDLNKILNDPAFRDKLGNILKNVGKSGDLTPVNAVLGQGIGNMLNGNKTLIGTAGILASTLVNRLNGVDGSTIQTLQHNVTPFMQPVALTVALWGLLGKYEKWVYGERKGSK